MTEKLREHKEVNIMPMDEETREKSDESEVDRAIQALIGAVPYTEMSLSEIREERLRKYEIVD
jgi:hypothetical protein